MRRIAAILMAALALAGCAHKDPALKPVTTFSLGSAKFKPFTERPTAKELYTTVLKLYDSFDTVSASYESYSRSVGEWAVQDGKAVDIRADEHTSQIEYRYKRPGMELILIDGKNPFPNADVPRNDPIAVWLKLGGVARPELARTIDRIRLLPDAKVSSGPVYVLELHLPFIKWKQGWNEPETRRFYLGKSDLLPRRIEIVEERKGGERLVKGLPSDTTRMVFSGFVVNRPLSDSLFSGPSKLPKR